MSGNSNRVRKSRWRQRHISRQIPGDTHTCIFPHKKKNVLPQRSSQANRRWNQEDGCIVCEQTVTPSNSKMLPIVHLLMQACFAPSESTGRFCGQVALARSDGMLQDTCGVIGPACGLEGKIWTLAVVAKFKNLENRAPSLTNFGVVTSLGTIVEHLSVDRCQKRSREELEENNKKETKQEGIL